MNVLATARRCAIFTIAAAAAIGTARSASLACGGGALASALATAASLICYVFGTFVKNPPKRIFLVFAALSAFVVLTAAPWIEPFAGRWIQYAGAGGAAAVFVVCLALCALPFAALGAICKETPIRYFGDLCFSSAAALLLTDGPLLSAGAANGIVWFAPILLIFFIKLAPPPADEEESPWIAPFILGAALAAGAAIIRLQLRGFIRGDLWSVSQLDAVGFVISGLGAWIVGGYLQKAGPAARAGAPALAGISFLLTLLRFATLQYRETFDSTVGRAVSLLGIGFSVDGAYYCILLAGGVVPLLFLAFGAAARGGSTFTVKNTRALLAGAALGIISITFLDARFSIAQKPDAVPFSPGFVTFSKATAVAFAAAAAAGILTTGRARIVSVASVLILGGAIYTIPMYRFRPDNLLNQTRILVPENHRWLSEFESIEGISGTVDAPEYKDQKVGRSVRTRFNRTSISPLADEMQSYLSSLRAAASSIEKPERILVLGSAVPKAELILTSAGAKTVTWAPRPFTGGADETNIISPAGLRDYHLIIWPPQPSDLDVASLYLNSRRLAALESALAPGGALAVFLDLTTTPKSVLLNLALSPDPPGGASRAIFISDGVAAPIFGSIRRMSGKLNITSGDLGSVATKGENYYTTPSWLPAITVDRNYYHISGRDYYDSNPRAARRENLLLIAELANFGEAGGDRAATLSLIKAIAEIEGENWNLSPFKTPLESRPIPQKACDEIVNCESARPGNAPARRAFLQISEYLKSQKQLSRLLQFSQKIVAIDPEFLEARLALAIAHRSLLDPEGALVILNNRPASGAPGGAEPAEIAVERAACEAALAKPEAAITTLKNALTLHPTDKTVVIALVETLLATGRAAEAATYATHLVTLAHDDPAAASLLDRARRAAAVESTPASRASEK